MDFERLFGDLENQFDAMLAQRERQSSCRAVELALQKTAPRELGGGARRILLTSPHLGADFVSGLEPKEGAWYALRLELVRSLRMLPSAGGLPGFAAELTRGAETLAQLSSASIRQAKRTVNALAAAASDAALASDLAALFSGADFIEGRAAFLERRPPRF